MKWLSLVAILLAFGCATSQRVIKGPRETIDDRMERQPPAPQRCVDFCARYGGGVARLDLSTCVCVVNGVEIREGRGR